MRGVPRAWLGLAGAALAVSALVAADAGLAQPSQPPAAPQAEQTPFLPMPTAPRRGAGPSQPSGVVVDVAYGAYQAGHYVEAFRQATRRIEADANDAASMTLLAELFEQGLGVRQDSRKAQEWYQLAARRGDVNAIFALGMMHLDGRGVVRDPVRAEVLLQQAADKGHGLASFNLALTLLASGTTENLAKAITLLRVAEKQEVGDAQHALAVLMLQGTGMEQDVEGGADMMARAAANGSLAGEVEFAILQFTGRGIGRDERAAARGFARAAARGNAIAQNRLARILIQGRWLPRAPVTAAGWHLAAKAQGLNDTFLDEELARLSPADRERAQALAEDAAAASALTRPGVAAQSTVSHFRK